MLHYRLLQSLYFDEPGQLLECFVDAVVFLGRHFKKRTAVLTGQGLPLVGRDTPLIPKIGFRGDKDHRGGGTTTSSQQGKEGLDGEERLVVSDGVDEDEAVGRVDVFLSLLKCLPHSRKGKAAPRRRPSPA